MERDAFVALVEQEVADLPYELRARIDNVAFRVEDRAEPSAYGLRGTRGQGLLLGVYRGVPLTRRNSGYNLVVPDEIVIFQGAIEQVARTPERVQALVRRTVRHEVAHYFGISDARLHELGAY